MSRNDSRILSAFEEIKIPRAHFQHNRSPSLADHSRLTASSSKFQIANPVIYTWKNLTVDIKVYEGSLLKRDRKSFRKRILDNASGAVKPGEFVAIMGASGAGKTTLLNCLTFRNGKSLNISGQRHLNGAAVNENTLARISGYVQQDDLFIGSLKVWEVLRFQALLRMDKHFTEDQRMERVEQVIQEFGLIKCRNTLIGMPEKGIKGISGGERKRLAFACEVLSNPSLMFCDEPTSGLDSFMAQNVVQALKNMASCGKTVICTIHQPSSEVFAMFDRILLMADGKTAFLGSTGEALEFFHTSGMPCPSNFNPADHFIFSLAAVPGFEAESRDRIASICERYQQSGNGIEIAKVVDSWHNPDGGATIESTLNPEKLEKSPYKASWSKQFSAVIWRSFLTVLRDPVFLFVKGIGSILLSLLVALLYQGQDLDVSSAFNIQGVIFLSITNATFETVFAVVSTFSLELPIFLREHRNGMYRSDVYFLCKTFAELFVYIVYPFISFAIPYYIIGLNPDVERFFIAAGIIVLVTNTATSFGYMISCLAPSPELALAIAPPMIIPMLLFGGYFLQSGSVPVYLDWIKYLSWFLYANEAMSINQWHDVDFQRTVCQILGNISEQIPPNVSTIAPPSATSSPLLPLLELLLNAIQQVRDSIVCTGEDILEMLNFRTEYFVRDIICLIALIVGFRVLAFLALLSKTYKK